MSSFATLPARLEAQWSSTATKPEATAHVRMRVNIAASGVTDPGGAKCRVNQDTFFTHCDVNNSAMVLGVFDGHGKEAGRDAALAAKDFFKEHFQSMARCDYEALEQNPQRVFSSMFHGCHDAIKSVLKSVYERRGFTVQEKDGYVVKCQQAGGGAANDQQQSCLRGGTTASIVVILDGGRKIWTANVGDSSVALGAKHDGVRIKRSDLLELQEDDVNNEPEAPSTHTKSKSRATTSSSNFTGSTKVVMLTGDHSPDNKREFLRARAFRPCESDRNEPELRFLFDSSDPRSKRKSIFHVDAKSGELTQSKKGDYLKNVRDEWATLVATPIESPFPDSLAFTRSLGDFHMHTYGVNCEPSVCELSLERIAERELFHGRHGNQEEEDDAMNSASNTESDDNNSELGSSSGFGYHDEDEKHSVLEFMLVAASDGVWDNWKFDELFQFLNSRDEKRARSSSGSSSSSNAKRDVAAGDTAPNSYAVDNAVATLLKANLRRAQSIFGDDSDNMTAVLCHFRVSS